MAAEAVSARAGTCEISQQLRPLFSRLLNRVERSNMIIYSTRAAFVGLSTVRFARELPKKIERVKYDDYLFYCSIKGVLSDENWVDAAFRR